MQLTWSNQVLLNETDFERYKYLTDCCNQSQCNNIRRHLLFAVNMYRGNDYSEGKFESRNTYRCNTISILTRWHTAGNCLCFCTESEAVPICLRVTPLHCFKTGIKNISLFMTCPTFTLNTYLRDQLAIFCLAHLFEGA